MQSIGSERRRHRRVALSVNILAKRVATGDTSLFEEGTTTDVSLAGVYFTAPVWKDLQAQEILTISISVPREKARDFPFSRLAGRGRVVRVDEVLGQTPHDKRVGVAVEFADNLTVLTAAPEHGW